MPNSIIYRPEIFEVPTAELAKSIIVTPEQGTTTEERWEKETAFLREDIGARLQLNSSSYVLDYGCGIGRLAKVLIERFGCRVIGVDMSQSMRLLAPDYVLSERFVVWSPETLAAMVTRGFRVDAAIAVWVLQHALEPGNISQLLASAIKPGGMLYTLNSPRCVPTNVGWVNDGQDVQAILRKVFDEASRYPLPIDATTAPLSANSLIQLLRAR